MSTTARDKIHKARGPGTGLHITQMGVLSHQILIDEAIMMSIDSLAAVHGKGKLGLGISID